MLGLGHRGKGAGAGGCCWCCSRSRRWWELVGRAGTGPMVQRCGRLTIDSTPPSHPALLLTCHTHHSLLFALTQDEVEISEPYTPANASTDASHRATLERVRKVLAAERTRLGLPNA